MSAKAFENDNYFMMDLIDAFRGILHCEKEWVKHHLKTRSPRDVQDKLVTKKYNRT